MTEKDLEEIRHVQESKKKELVYMVDMLKVAIYL